MEEKVKITRQEEKLIEELMLTIADMDSQNNELKDLFFKCVAGYVEGIKLGLNFQKNRM